MPFPVSHAHLNSHSRLQLVLVVRVGRKETHWSMGLISRLLPWVLSMTIEEVLTWRLLPWVLSVTTEEVGICFTLRNQKHTDSFHYVLRVIAE